MSTTNERSALRATPRGASDYCTGSGRGVPSKTLYTCSHCGRSVSAVGSGATWSIARHYPRTSAYQPNTEPREAAERTAPHG